MHNVVLVAVLCAKLLILQVTGQSLEKFFRQDYKYLADTSGFYKIHTLAKTWQDAKQRCELEGAHLFFPEDELEVETVTMYWNRTHAFNEIYIGISDFIAKEMYTSVNGDSLRDVYNNFGSGKPDNVDGNENCLVLNLDATLKNDQCNKRYPYICKKTLASLNWNTLCNIPDFDYTYNEELGRCYKLHKKMLNWTEAALVCDIEESYLAILDTEIEAKYLSRLANDVFGTDINTKSSDAIALGFNNKNKNGWETILGTNLNETEYVQWAENGHNKDNAESCGYMNNVGLLKSLSCETKTYFVCEHENQQIGTLDDRNGQ